MRWWLYQFLFAIAYVAMMPKFLLRMKRRGGYSDRFADRFGRYPDEVISAAQKGGAPVWIHAVSVGETIVAVQVMKALREVDPAIHFVLSTTSSTGRAEALRRADARDVVVYCPLDFPPCVKRALSAFRPRAFILVETELWPNLIRACRRRSVPLFLVNARVSDRSAPGYRRLRFWFGPALRCFTRIFAQSDLDADRLVAAGADRAAIEVTGSFKFDAVARNVAKEEEIAAWLALQGVSATAPVLLGASTWPGEDILLLDAFRALHEIDPALRLVLAPRHFEKADAVEANIRARGFDCVRKSRGDHGRGAATEVILADTTGELTAFCARAQIAFVGKTLCAEAVGGQNMIEPCGCGCATIVGPHTENFRPVMSDLLQAGAVLQVKDAAELLRALERLVADASARAELAARATAAVAARRGATLRCARWMVENWGVGK